MVKIRQTCTNREITLQMVSTMNRIIIYYIAPYSTEEFLLQSHFYPNEKFENKYEIKVLFKSYPYPQKR